MAKLIRQQHAESSRINDAATVDVILRHAPSCLIVDAKLVTSGYQGALCSHISLFFRKPKQNLSRRYGLVRCALVMNQEI